MYLKLLSLFLLVFVFIGCEKNVPKPTVKHKKQYVNKTVTENHFKIIDFKKMIENDNLIEPIYIYISNSLHAEAASAELPDIKKMTYSLLSDFGKKVVIITSREAYESYKSDDSTKDRTYILDGALTSFDENIESESSSTSLNLSFGSGDDKVKNKDKYKNKKRTSQLIGDFYLKRDGIIEEKTTSSIFIRETNVGYQFGLNLYGVSLGVSSYKNVTDGIGLSVRKIVEASLIDLVAKTIGIKTFQVIPEVQAKKTKKKYKHLSNFDFCSDINKLVFYINAFRDKKFNKYGITYESELNKLKCLKDLYEKESDILIKLKSITTNRVSLSKSQKNANLLRREISKIGVSRSSLIIENKVKEEVCLEDEAYCEFLDNKVELEKLYSR